MLQNGNVLLFMDAIIPQVAHRKPSLLLSPMFIYFSLADAFVICCLHLLHKKKNHFIRRHLLLTKPYRVLFVTIQFGFRVNLFFYFYGWIKFSVSWTWSAVLMNRWIPSRMEQIGHLEEKKTS